MCPAASSRWCPTPEQLMILEELYRSGIRTPNAPQIQRITAHLSLYGKIEGKNVFYWFQNHKARDRQKLRRKLIKQLQHQQLVFHQNHQNQPNLSLLNYFDPPPPPPPPTSALHQLGLHTAPLIPPPPQGEGVEGGAAAAQMMHHYTWKVENYPQKDHQEHHHDEPMMMMRLHHQHQHEHRHQHEHQQTSHDWMMMMEMGPAAADPYASSSPACCNTRTTLKTLELFPITSTNLKEECKNNENHNNNNSSN